MQRGIGFCALYANRSPAYTSGGSGPSAVACDTATSDIYFSSALLSEAVQNITTLFTEGTGVYCSNQQEDNAILEVLLHTTISNHVNLL